MNKKSDIAQYLEKLSGGYDEKLSRKCNPRLIYKFLSSSSETIFKDLDVYCFKIKTTVDHLARSQGQKIIFLSAIHPIIGTDRALSVSIMRWVEQTENEQIFGIRRIRYDIDVSDFNLIKTAGDPVDLAALRGEKIILNVLDGETPEQICQKGAFREYKKIFQRKFSQTIYPFSAVHTIINLFRKRDSYRVLENKIVLELEKLLAVMRWCIDNPEINHFRTKRAINHK